MKFAAVLVALLLFAVNAAHSQTHNEKEKTMKVTRITPVLFAANIEPCVKFWTERLGFQKTAEVPEGNTLGFAILEKDGVELMYQSYASADKDNASTGPLVRKGPSFLYIEVNDLDAVIRATAGIEPAIPMRTTFYGMREMGVKDPAGHVILFAQKVEKQ
ncbi:MAG TPA: VOC family protein [Candidatus Acidoferrales bacterium]|nr:VOC family protein [Candidatus Acidoferrales bacterium]